MRCFCSSLSNDWSIILGVNAPFSVEERMLSKAKPIRRSSVCLDIPASDSFAGPSNIRLIL